MHIKYDLVFQIEENKVITSRQKTIFAKDVKYKELLFGIHLHIINTEK